MAKTAVITGASGRIGAAMAQFLHNDGFDIIIHYHQSGQAANRLIDKLNSVRIKSAYCLNADLCDIADIRQLSEKINQIFGHIDVLINNASRFYPTDIHQANQDQWHDIFSSNLSAPFFLTQSLLPILKNCVINMVDIHGQKPLKGHCFYSVAKAGLVMLTKSLALELAPNIRVNGIAPGAILAPPGETHISEAVLMRTAQKRQGSVADINHALDFLLKANYVTGQIIVIDGGISLN